MARLYLPRHDLCFSYFRKKSFLMKALCTSHACALFAVMFKRLSEQVMREITASDAGSGLSSFSYTEDHFFEFKGSYPTALYHSNGI